MAEISVSLFTAVAGVCLRKLGERQKPVATSPNLEDMKLPELKELAKQMGLRGTSTMRKPDLSRRFRPLVPAVKRLPV